MLLMIRIQRFVALPQPKTCFSLSELSTRAVICQSLNSKQNSGRVPGASFTNKSSTSLTISRWPSSAFPPSKKHQMLHLFLVVLKYPHHGKGPCQHLIYTFSVCLGTSAFWTLGVQKQHQFPEKISPSKLCCATTTSGAALCRAAAASRGTPRRSAARRRCRSSAGRVLATRQVPVRWLLKRA